MLELLQWVHLSAKKVEAAQSLSNALLILYFLSFTLNRKSFCIGAFLLIEFFGSSSLFDGLSSSFYYVYYAALYAFCYWYQIFKGKNIKIALAYGIMVLFQSAMVLDAIFYPDIETSIYAAYEYIVVAIHLYIIIVLTDFKKLRSTLVSGINSVSNFLGIGYNLSFCYTVNNILNQIKKQCP